MEKALLIENQSHELSEAGEGEFQVESNFAGHTLNELRERCRRILRNHDEVEILYHGSFFTVDNNDIR